MLLLLWSGFETWLHPLIFSRSRRQPDRKKAAPHRRHLRLEKLGLGVGDGDDGVPFYIRGGALAGLRAHEVLRVGGGLAAYALQRAAGEVRRVVDECWRRGLGVSVVEPAEQLVHCGEAGADDADGDFGGAGGLSAAWVWALVCGGAGAGQGVGCVGQGLPWHVEADEVHSLVGRLLHSHHKNHSNYALPSNVSHLLQRLKCNCLSASTGDVGEGWQKPTAAVATPPAPSKI